MRQRIENEEIDEENVDGAYLERLEDATNELGVLVYTGPETGEIAWLLQGIRHVSGIRDWDPAQRGRLVAIQIDEHGLGLREAGQRFGLSTQRVGRYYRGYKGLEQMRRDDEYQAQASNEYFTLFEEAIRKASVKKWLGWDDRESAFMETDNLRQFYSWIVPDPEAPSGKNPRRIHDPRHIQKLDYLIAGGHDALLSQIDQHTLTIEAAYERATEIGQKHDWKHNLERAADLIGSIPQSAIAKESDAVLESLGQLEKAIADMKTMATAIKGS